MIANTVTVIILARMFSPILIAPGVAAALSMAMVLMPRFSMLGSPVTIGLFMTGAIAVPLALEQLGVLSTTMSVSLGRHPVRRSGGVGEHETPTILVGALYAVALIAASRRRRLPDAGCVHLKRKSTFTCRRGSCASSSRTRVHRSLRRIEAPRFATTATRVATLMPRDRRITVDDFAGTAVAHGARQLCLASLLCYCARLDGASAAPNAAREQLRARARDGRARQVELDADRHDPAPRSGTSRSAGSASCSARTRRKAEFGLMTFPRPNQCGPGGARRRARAEQPDRDPEHARRRRRPTRATTRRWRRRSRSRRTEPSLQTAVGARHVVLITDGWQWCLPYDPATRFDATRAVDEARTTRASRRGSSASAPRSTPCALNQMAVAARHRAPELRPARATIRRRPTTATSRSTTRPSSCSARPRSPARSSAESLRRHRQRLRRSGRRGPRARVLDRVRHRHRDLQRRHVGRLRRARAARPRPATATTTTATAKSTKPTTCAKRRRLRGGRVPAAERRGRQQGRLRLQHRHDRSERVRAVRGARLAAAAPPSPRVASYAR